MPSGEIQDHPGPEADEATSSPPPDVASSSTETDQPASGWQYTPEDAMPQSSELEPVSWTASEYIDHEKRAGWFLAVAGIAAVTAAIIYLLTHDVVNGIVIIIVGGLFAVSGARRPRTLQYALDARGVHIANKFYDYGELKSFSVMDEGGLSSIQLFQFKRFTTPITLYFPPDQEETIVNFLGSYLPHETRSHDPIDRLMRKVRF